MPAAVPLTAIGGTVGGAAVGGLSAGAMAAISIGGSVLAGAAQGWMKQKEIEREEDRIDKEQRRRTDSYRGLGESTSFRRQATERAQSRVNSMPGLGQRPDMLGNRADQVGKRTGAPDYQQIAEKRQRGLPRYEYDPETGRIVRN